MKVLLTNDDGLSAPGLAAVASGLLSAGVSLEIVAPAEECSASGHSITLRRPLTVHRTSVDIPPHGPVDAYAVEGTPADCVKFAATTLFPHRSIDFVVSGINRGPNVGINVLYSGTVAAVMEAAIQSLPGIALSVEFPREDSVPVYERAARIGTALISLLLELPALPAVPVYNVNFPDESRPLQGVALTRQSAGGFRERYVCKSPCESWPRSYSITGEYLLPEDKDSSADAHALHNGCISITPLGLDLSHARQKNVSLPSEPAGAIRKLSKRLGLPFSR
ncbi:MAG: 5'/3'-nucleotidase SurE [Planctomycetes bacterium]|nr:5'/3'-nucleotidase SurE [Planctomycetota bacterium]